MKDVYLLVFHDEDVVALLANESSLIREPKGFSLQDARKVVLPAAVEIQTDRVELTEDILDGVVHPEASCRVVQHHGCGRVSRLQFEHLVESLALRFPHILIGELDDEADRGIGVVLFVVVDERRSLLTSVEEALHHSFFVSLGPNT